MCCYQFSRWDKSTCTHTRYICCRHTSVVPPYVRSTGVFVYGGQQTNTTCAHLCPKQKSRRNRHFRHRGARIVQPAKGVPAGCASGTGCPGLHGKCFREVSADVRSSEYQRHGVLRLCPRRLGAVVPQSLLGCWLPR